MGSVYVYDPDTNEVVTKDEIAKRRASRPKAARSTLDFGNVVERGVWVWDASQQRIVSRDEYWRRRYGHISEAHQVMRDLEPYKGTATGQMVDGRAQHRDYLKRNGLRELGNEKEAAMKRTPKPLPPIEETIKRAFEAHESGYRPRHITQQQFDEG